MFWKTDIAQIFQGDLIRPTLQSEKKNALELRKTLISYFQTLYCIFKTVIPQEIRRKNFNKPVVSSRGKFRVHQLSCRFRSLILPIKHEIRPNSANVLTHRLRLREQLEPLHQPKIIIVEEEKPDHNQHSDLTLFGLIWALNLLDFDKLTVELDGNEPYIGFLTHIFSLFLWWDVYFIFVLFLKLKIQHVFLQLSVTQPWYDLGLNST